MSSIRGRLEGIVQFVTLKTPQILTSPDCFTMGTIGVSQSLVGTLKMTPSCSNRSSSFSTFGLIAYSSGLAVVNTGLASSFKIRFA